MSFAARLYEIPVEEKSTAGLRAPRTQTLIEATIRTTREQAHNVVVHNLSSGGVLVTSDVELVQGAQILLDIPGLGQTPARVAWQGDQFYGCAFLTPISDQAVAAKLASTKVVWPKFGRRSEPSIADRAAASSAIPFEQQQAWQNELGLADRLAAGDRWSARTRVAILVSATALCWAIPATIIATIWF